MIKLFIIAVENYKQMASQATAWDSECKEEAKCAQLPTMKTYQCTRRAFWRAYALRSVGLLLKALSKLGGVTTQTSI